MWCTIIYVLALRIVTHIGIYKNDGHIEYSTYMQQERKLFIYGDNVLYSITNQVQLSPLPEIAWNG